MTVAVWGPPGCGKTALSVRLALGMSEKETAALLFCDTLAPPLAEVLSSGKEELLSVGGALSSVEISEENVLKYANLYRSDGNIILFGYAPGENSRSYPVFSEGRAAAFIETLAKTVDHLVIDCTSDAADDPLCVAALRNSDRVLRVYSPERSSIIFYESNLSMFPDSEFNTGKHIRILNCPDGEIFPPLSETAEGMKRCDGVFPYFRILKQRRAEGRELERGGPRRLLRATEKLCGFCIDISGAETETDVDAEQNV